MRRQAVGLNACCFKALAPNRSLEKGTKRMSHLLVEFEGVAKRVQAFRLLGVGVSKGLRGGFEEVLVVSHLGYWHTVELVCRGRV